MTQFHVIGAAVLGVNAESDGLANLELSAHEVDSVRRLDLVVVGGVGEGQGKHTLLLKVGLVDTGKTAGDDSKTTKVTRLQSSVLTRATLTVVPVTNDNPLNATGLVITGGSRDSIVLVSEGVADAVGLTVLSVDGTDQHVVGDVVKVATVLQPRTSHGDVVGGGLTLALDQDGEVGGVLAVPFGEATENLQTLTLGGDGDIHRLTVRGRSLVGVTAGVITLGGKTLTRRGVELELLAILVLQGVGERVEFEGTSDGHSNDQVGGGDEGMGGGVGVVTASEVTVVGRDDGVGLAFLHILTVPLSNARTASVGENDTTKLLESLELAITRDGSTNLLRTGGDGEHRLGLDTVIKGIPGNGGGTGHVLIRRVGARTN